MSITYEPTVPLAEFWPAETSEQLHQRAERNGLDVMVDYLGRLAVSLPEAYRCGELLAAEKAAEAEAEAKAEAAYQAQMAELEERNGMAAARRRAAANLEASARRAALMAELEEDQTQTADFKRWEAKVDAIAAATFAQPEPAPQPSRFPTPAEIVAKAKGVLSGDGLNYDAEPPAVH